MGKHEKLIEKLLSRPNTFLWRDLCLVMQSLGFEIVKGNGSRRKFINNKTGQFASWHEPHPGKEVKFYVIKEAIELVKEYRNEQ
ncbi:type II toxin-antitoxin system HicA family toxin [Alkalimonas collagenimarina]|uniref:Type II toxin-antitoxin system HicA family toxin n=1 Tax=Alkalimonas collagenimarina TaxID=400390 RepID=A0ABT9H3V6_9GAMM|nr:type II toxin-antitoxin system HicA family toxin [Alkalimonas collagenimarina]MDP4537744.1 type II toxin-antitoxin system HicA family toxin [Alkalimonas collagenimarina]